MSREESWDVFKMTMISIMDKHIPKTQPNKSKKKNLWMTVESMKQWKRKKTTWRRFLNTRRGEGYIRAKQESNKL